MAPSVFIGLRYNNVKAFEPLMDTLLSIITPIFCSDYVVAKLKQSLGETNIVGIERIIVHDCPESRDCRKLDDLQPKPGSLTILKSGAQNVGIARNIGLKQATGSWVVFWDADDNANIEATLEVIEDASDSNLELAICSYTMKDAQTNLRKKGPSVSKIEIINLLSVANQPALWRMIIKSTTAKRGVFSAKNLAEDQYYFSTIAKMNPNIGFYKMSIYEYQVNLSGQLTSKKIDTLAMTESIKQISKLPDYKTSIASRILIRGICVRLSMTLIGNDLKARKISFSNIKLFLTQIFGYGLIGFTFFIFKRLQKNIEYV